MAGPRTLKRIQYQQTQDLLQGMNQETAGLTHVPNVEQTGHVPTETTTNLNSLRTLRYEFGLGNRSLMRDHLQTLLEILNDNNKLPGVNELQHEYNQLLNRLNLGESVSLSDFEAAIKKFSVSHQYMVALQDGVNNKELDLETHPEEDTEEAQQSSDTGDSSQADQQPEEEPEQHRQEEESQGQEQKLPKREPPRRVVQQRPKPNKELTEEEDIERRKQKRQRKQERREGRKERRRANRNARRAQQKFNNSRLGRFYQRLNRGVERVKDSTSNSRVGRGLRRVNSLLGAPGRFLNRLLSRLGNRFASRFLNNRFGRALGRVGRVFDALDKFLNPIDHFIDKMVEKLASRLGKLAWQGAKLAAQLAMQAARLLANLVARALSSLASQAAGAIARTALGTLGRGALLLLANPITWVVIGLSAALFGFFWYVSDINRECGQPGVVELTKSANKETFQLGETIEYKINVVYKIRCRTAYAAATVRDRIPANTTYVPDSAKSSFPYGFINITGPKGILDGNTLIWKLDNLGPDEPNTLTFSVTPNQTGIWIANQATLTYQTGALGPGGKIIDSQSRSFQETVNKAAEMNGMPPALMKAILAVEAPGSLTYTEEEFLKFSKPGWWEGLAENDPDIERGYAYNSCLRNGCPSNDVRGIAQFELGTWNGIAPKLNFSDGHIPDRRNATDSIYGSALLNRENAEKYVVGSSDVKWTEDVVKAMGRVYCGGSGAATDRSKIDNDQCRNYDDLLWGYYQQFLQQP